MQLLLCQHLQAVQRVQFTANKLPSRYQFSTFDELFKRILIKLVGIFTAFFSPLLHIMIIITFDSS